MGKNRQTGQGKGHPATCLFRCRGEARV